MQGAQNLRSEAYLQVRRNDEGKAQRRRWTFYFAIHLMSFYEIIRYNTSNKSQYYSGGLGS